MPLMFSSGSPVSWRKVFLHKKIVVLSVFFLLQLFSVLVTLFYRQQFLDQVSTMTSQVEVMAEVKGDLEQESLSSLEAGLAKLPMVKNVEYWSPSRSSQYIDRTAFSGYLDFLRKSGLEAPFPPLFRLQLLRLEDKQKLETMLEEKYGDALRLVDSSLSKDAESFSHQFLSKISGTAKGFQIVVILQAVMLLAMYVGILVKILWEWSFSRPSAILPSFFATLLYTAMMLVFVTLLFLLFYQQWFFPVWLIIWLLMVNVITTVVFHVFIF